MRSILAAPLFAVLLSAGLAGAAAAASVPRAVETARATRIPACTVFVDAAAAGTGSGTRSNPYRALDVAVDRATAGAVLCVAEGVYRVQLRPGDKPLTLAGGFRSGRDFRVRDSARFVTRAEGDGTGSFLLIEDPAPSGRQLTAVDGFEITGYARAIVRDTWYSQRLDLTNNHIHDNDCADPALAGAGFALVNVSGTIAGNVIEGNSCGRGGAGVVNDSTNENRVTFLRNRIVGNAGDEPQSSHGGGLYLFVNRLTVTGNHFEGNTVTGWGAGLYVGAFTPGGQFTTAKLAWNVYVGNRAGIAGGGFFCDDGATCLSDHEIYRDNCGGNVYLDSGPSGEKPTVARFDHMTNVGALNATCRRPGEGIRIDKGSDALDSYSVVNALFSGNARRRDVAVFCGESCDRVDVSVRWSMAQRPTVTGGSTVAFGPGILAPQDPLFADPSAGDLHLKSRFGRWTPTGRVVDPVASPALAKGDPRSPVPANPPRAGKRTELGAYGNSPEASYVR